MRLEGSYSEYLREQFRDMESYFDQATNIIVGIIRFASQWAFSTTVLTSSVVILWFLFVDTTSITPSKAIATLQGAVLFAGYVALISCLLTNAGRFKYVFGDKAIEKKMRHDRVRAEIISRHETIEYVLLHHGLISEKMIFEQSIIKKN